MHSSVFEWVREQVERLDVAGAHVLDVGSLDVNGSTRPLFNGGYLGVDLRAGPGVDVIADAAALPFPDGSFDVVVSTEMLEHDPYPWRSITEMARVLRPGGHLLISARGPGYKPHDHPGDYYRFTTSSFRLLLGEVAGLDVLAVLDDPDETRPGVFGLARRGTGAQAPPPDSTPYAHDRPGDSSLADGRP